MYKAPKAREVKLPSVLALEPATPVDTIKS